MILNFRIVDIDYQQSIRRIVLFRHIGKVKMGRAAPHKSCHCRNMFLFGDITAHGIDNFNPGTVPGRSARQEYFLADMQFFLHYITRFDLFLNLRSQFFMVPG